ncbi:MAG: glycosyltransferase family 4 protein [Phycisphaerae bacterium]|jgi:glycosyltransferase involved in cell wall biosynthesis|nr:glycosyltransferase family 4 protein [Phycisphaerae bacterium]
MKICHVITRLILGGAQENTLLTCEGLHQRGHDVTLITGPAIGPEGQLITRAHSGGYRVVEMDDMRREISPIRDRRAYRRLVSLLGEIRPDIMHSHSSKAGILARKAATALGGMKIVHTVHGLPYHRYLSRWRNRLYIALEKRGAQRSDAIISVADAMTRQALAAGVGRPEQYTTIYSGMEVDHYLNPRSDEGAFRDSLGLEDDAILVTMVSRLAELKGHEYILDAAENTADRHVRFCFVGDGRWRDRITSEIKRRGLADRFHLTGLLPPERIPAVMAGSDIVVHCSLREGLARALPQAMLSGRPVISFDIDGAREVVNDSTGVLLAPGDVAGLTDAIDKLACDPELRRSLGSAGREKCREMFSHHRMVDRIEELYQRLPD